MCNLVYFVEDNVHEAEPEPAAYAPVPLQNVEVRDIGSCVECLSLQATYACVPCGHKCLCEPCSQENIRRCPMCQAEIIMWIQIFDHM